MSASAIAAELGGRIRQLRLRRNLTQLQLAQMANTSLSSVRRLEATGQGTIELLVRLGQALQVTDQFEVLFTTAALPSIAEVERLAHMATRQRARAKSGSKLVRQQPKISA
jgi:transcriptional regulator with XRE-family HTH domain